MWPGEDVLVDALMDGGNQAMNWWLKSRRDLLAHYIRLMSYITYPYDRVKALYRIGRYCYHSSLLSCGGDDNR